MNYWVKCMFLVTMVTLNIDTFPSPSLPDFCLP